MKKKISKIEEHTFVLQPDLIVKSSDNTESGEYVFGKLIMTTRCTIEQCAMLRTALQAAIDAVGNLIDEK